MTNTTKAVGLVIAGAIVGLLLYAVGGSALGGVYSQTEQNFREGIKVGTSNQFVVSSTGAVTTSGAMTASGAFSLTSTLSVSGATAVETFTEGGGIYATSTDDTSATMLAADFDVENMIEFTPLKNGITLTSPASSTLSSFAPNAGDHRSLLICNATTTAGINGRFTFAAGTGTNLALATTSVTVYSGECAELEFWRASDTDFEVFYDLGN